MKKFNLFLVMFFMAIVSLQAEDAEKNTVIVFEPTFTDMKANQGQGAKTQIREEISSIVGSNGSYTLVDWQQIEVLVNMMVETATTPVFDQSTCIKLGNIYGAKKVIMTEIIPSIDKRSYIVYCKQLDVATAVVEKQGKGTIRCSEYLHLAAREAASEFAENKRELLRMTERDKELYCDAPLRNLQRPVKTKEPIKSPLRIKSYHTTTGFSVGYEHRNRALQTIETGVIENLNYWDQKLMQGVQAGLHFDKYFAPNFFGLGVHTGIYAGYYSLEGKLSPDGDDNLSFQDLRLYIPLQGIYRFDFSSNIGCFVTYGLSADIGLYSRIKMKIGEEIGMHKNIYDKEEWSNIKRLNYSLTYGAGVQVNHLMISVSSDTGLLNQSDDDSFKITENRDFRLNLTLMF